MPYSREHANSVGYEGILTDPFLRDRLRSYGFRPFEEKIEESPAVLMPTVEARTLSETLSLEDLSSLYAIDGSTASLPEGENSFELTALKLGVVKQDFQAWLDLKSWTGPLSPHKLASIYAHYSPLTLLPGEGVFGSNPGEDLWQDKFREELYATFQHFTLPFASGPAVSLLDILRSLAPSKLTTRCIACQEAGRLTREENVISLTGLGDHCARCYRDAYFTDFLFTESWLREGKSSALPLALMLIIERIMMMGLIQEAGSASQLSTTAFIVDGPLAFYSTHSLNTYVSDFLARQSTFPALLGVEKTGTYVRFAHSPGVQEKLMPGHLAMVTDEVVNSLRGISEAGKQDKTYTFARRFFYRSKDGARTFVFMAPPLNASSEGTDDWHTYPHLRFFTELLEQQTTSAFGTEVAAIEIVAEANHTASLPARLSPRFLQDLLRGSGAPVQGIKL